MQLVGVLSLCIVLLYADLVQSAIDCTSLSTDLTNLQQELNQLKSARKQPIAFMYELSQDLKPKSGQTVKFDKKHLAIGGGYSPSTGLFIAPVSGLYHFMLGASSIKATKEKLLHLRIMQGNQDKAYVFLDHNDDRWLNHYASALLKLNKGERVYVRVTNVRDNPTLNGKILHTMFGGYLIQAI